MKETTTQESKTLVLVFKVLDLTSDRRTAAIPLTRRNVIIIIIIIIIISFAKPHCQAFESATTTERLQVGEGYTVPIKNYLN